MYKYVNLTPHPIHLMSKNGHFIQVIEPSGMVARIRDEKNKTGQQDNILFYDVQQSCIVGLPQENEGTIYIVSQLILRAVGHIRKDVYTPLPVYTYKNKIKASQGLYRLGETYEQDIPSFII